MAREKILVARGKPKAEKLLERVVGNDYRASAASGDTGCYICGRSRTEHVP